MDALSLIDVSAEDDFLLDLASPPQHPDPPRAAPGTSVVGAGSEQQPAPGSPPAAAARGRVVDPTAQGPERAESPKKAKPKGGVNLRKSLAWDKAFFTSEGVLDTEELGIVNSTFRKSQGSRLLPGIAEELRKSTESTTSTLDSESYVLESLETELFDNVRASIQRTLGKPDKAPAVASASIKTPRATAKAPPVPARKGVDRIPQAQSKIRPPASASNGCIGGKQKTQVTLKEPAAARVAVSKAAETKPSSKPPRALPRVATMRAPTNTAVTSGIPDKRSSTGGVVNRQSVAKSANSSASVPSRPGWGTKNNSTSRSGTLSSAATPSLHSSPMAGGKTKSPTLISKTRTAQRIPIRSSSRSDISKVDTARASRNKSHGEGASPIISPSSSVDSMSSVISGVSTASTVGRVSHTSETFSTRSSSLSPSTRKSNDQPPSTLPRPSGTFSENEKSHIDTANQGNGCKPSGLRRPTPKIGYFDAEKSVEQKAGARVQLQPTNILFSPLAKIPASLTFEQEPKSRAASSSQTKTLPSLPLIVAQAEVKPLKLTEPEASQSKASTPLPIRVAQTDVKPSKVTEPEASQTEALPLLSPRVAETEVDPSKVTEHEASQTESLPLMPPRVSETEVEPAKVAEHDLSGTKASPSLSQAGAVQTEVETPKVSKHEAHVQEVDPLVSMDIAEEGISALHQNVQANGDASSSTVELSACTLGQQQSETTAAPSREDEPLEVIENEVCMPLGVAQMEIEPPEVIEHEACMPLGVAKMEVEPVEVIENEACMHQACPVLEAMDIAKENIPAMDTAKENVQPSGYLSPLKENILASNQNMQSNEEHMTPVKGNILASHTNVQAVVEMTPMTLLSQKLSSISLGPAAGEATPLTLLAQKLASVSLGDATD